MRDQLTGLKTAPAGKETVVSRGHSQGLDVVEHQRADTCEQSLLALQGMAPVCLQARDRPRGRRVQHGQPDHDQRQQRLVDKYHRQEQDAHRHFDDEREKMLRQARGDPVDGQHARAQFAGDSMVEEFHRQTQQLRHVAIAGDYGYPNREALQTTLLEPGEAADQYRRRDHGPGDRTRPGVATHQHAIDEDGQQRGDSEGQQGEPQPTDDGISERGPATPQPSRKSAQDVGALTPSCERGPRRELQSNTGVALAEFVGGESAAAKSRIVDIVPLAIEAFDDDEVVELPEQDERERIFFQILPCQGIAGAFKAIVPGGTHDAGGGSAVAADSAPGP